jgi:hypothetical protein
MLVSHINAEVIETSICYLEFLPGNSRRSIQVQVHCARLILNADYLPVCRKGGTAIVSLLRTIRFKERGGLTTSYEQRVARWRGVLDRFSASSTTEGLNQIPSLMLIDQFILSVCFISSVIYDLFPEDVTVFQQRRPLMQLSSSRCFDQPLACCLVL